MATSRVAVVGAGLAGLSAAVELKQRGFVVELLERSRLLGGKATSFKLGDVEVDNGQHVYLACCTEFIDFVRNLDGAPPAGEPALFLQERFDALLLARNRPSARLRAVSLPAPWHLAPALLRYRHLDLPARLRVGRALLDVRVPARPGETFAAWLKRHGQSAAMRRAFWDPFLIPALNAPLEEVAADAALFVIATAFLRDAGAARFGFARVPLARIAEAAARRLDRVHLRTPVVGLDLVEQSPGDLELRALVVEGGSRLSYDGVVIAVPPDRLKRVLGRPERFGVFGLDDIRTAPIVDVHLWYDAPALGFGFAALLDSPVQWVFEKAPGYLCCSMSAADQYVNWASSALVELCRRELGDVLPALRQARLLHGAATRDRDATFVPAPGLRRPGPATSCAQVVIAGAWTDTGWPATMESAVRSGRAAARSLAAHLQNGEEHANG
ncbi:MAG TPA: hydroxysqualene dehydroxylase HpnE [Ktedonobacterales bacterium]